MQFYSMEIFFIKCNVVLLCICVRTHMRMNRRSREMVQDCKSHTQMVAKYIRSPGEDKELLKVEGRQHSIKKGKDERDALTVADSKHGETHCFQHYCHHAQLQNKGVTGHTLITGIKRKVKARLLLLSY